MIALGLLLAASVARAQQPALDELRALAEPSLPAMPVPGARRVLRGRELCLFDGRTGLPVAEAAALARAAAADVVYVGEKHDEPAHHARQAELIRRLAEARPGAGAAFEMLYASQQPLLDRYLAGALDDEAFQSAVDWKRTWGFPFSLYEPVFEALRSGSRRGAALNVPKAVVHKVAESGLASLTAEERAFVPADFRAVTEPGYVAMLRDTFQAHGGDLADAPALARFVDAMSLWNEGMADNLARFLDRRPGGPVVVVAGAFHAYAAGMPASLARRRPALAQASFVLADAPFCPTSWALPAGLPADYVWVLTP